MSVRTLNITNDTRQSAASGSSQYLTSTQSLKRGVQIVQVATAAGMIIAEKECFSPFFIGALLGRLIEPYLPKEKVEIDEKRARSILANKMLGIVSIAAACIVFFKNREPYDRPGTLPGLFVMALGWEVNRTVDELSTFIQVP